LLPRISRGIVSLHDLDPFLIQEIANYNHSRREEQQQRRGYSETAPSKEPRKRTELKRSLRLVGETSTQTEIEIRRRGHSSKAADHPTQVCLLLLKLATLVTFLQVCDSSSSAPLFKHQLIDFSTNYFAIVSFHNFCSYK
jgi:hypothetical protein